MRQETSNGLKEVRKVGLQNGGNVTAAELLTELETIQGAFKWHVTKKGRIRAWLNNSAESRVFDPITAVAYHLTGEFFPEGNWMDAASTLGLVYSDCAEIVAACNYEWDPACRQGALRHEFLHALVAGSTPVKTSSQWHWKRSSPSVSN